MDITQLILDDHAEQRRLFAIIEQIDPKDTDALTAVSGVNAGARVVVDGAGFLNEGDRVNVAPAVAGQPAAAQPAAAN